MPMVWNAEADAKLFAAVLKVHDIKCNYAALATEMGHECTAKAITHRIQKLKAESKASGSAPATPAAKRVRAPAAPKAPASSTPKSRPSRKNLKQAQYPLSGDDEAANDDSDDVYEEAKEKLEEGASPSKKFKTEHYDEEGQDGV